MGPIFKAARDFDKNKQTAERAAKLITFASLVKVYRVSDSEITMYVMVATRDMNRNNHLVSLFYCGGDDISAKTSDTSSC